MIKIVADDKIPFLKGVLEEKAEVIYLPGKDINTSVVKDADALIIRTRTKCNAALLEGSSVKFIATATIGFDHLDTFYLKQQGIEWTNAPGCNSGSVQQYIGAVLSTLALENNFSLKEKNLGIVGVGNVGSKVQKIAEILGMQVLLNDPPRERTEGKGKFVSLDELLKTSDIVTLHVPLNEGGPDNTFHLGDHDFFERMKTGSYLINSSRGEVVDNTKLKTVLSGNKLSGAVLDVWEHEPEIDTELLNKVNLGTPHIAGYSLDGKANGTAMSVQAVSRFFGLGQDNWFPDSVPLPERRHITLDGKDKTSEQLLQEAILHTYSVKQDDTRLRISPHNFETQRGNYPLRREFPAYHIKLINTRNDVENQLTDLGFQLKENETE